MAGNLVESPRRSTTQSGRDYYLFRIATSDPPGPPGPDGRGYPGLDVVGI